MNPKIKKVLINSGIFACLAFLGWVFIFHPESIGLAPGTAHASLHEDLTQNSGANNAWIFNIWKIAMSLANAFAAVVLLFFAFVNIAHVQYDTYQLKKTLPLLIIGIVMANFSMVIVRMIVDFSSVLVLTFTQDTKGMMEGVMCAVSITTKQGAVSYITPGAIAFTAALETVKLIILILIFLIIMIGILILSFLLLIRKIIIYALAATAPIAFIMLAFPPTESYFKQWWQWFMNWVFMGPIVLFMLFIAGKVGGNNCGQADILKMFAAIGLVYGAAIVPFQLGGTIMSAWGNLGKNAATAAYNNPWSKAARAKSGGKLAGWFDKTKLGQSILKAQAAEEYHTGNREEDRLRAMGRARDAFHRDQARIRRGPNRGQYRYTTNYEEQVERSIGAKRVKEQVADLDLTSRAGLSEAFQRMHDRGDDLGVKALMEYAASNGMVADLMGEADESIKRKYGNESNMNITRNADGTIDYSKSTFKSDLAAQQDFVRGVVTEMSGGQDDIRTRERIQEAWVKAGIASAKTIVRDSSQPSGYRELDLGDPNEAGIDAATRQRRLEDKARYIGMTTKRFQSAHAQKGLQNLRKETFFNDDGTLSEGGLALIKSGMLTPEHIKLLGRSRTALLQSFNGAGNVERIESAAAAEADPAKKTALTETAKKLRELGYGSPTAGGRVVVAGGPNQGKEIAELTPQETASETTQKQIIERITDGYTPDQTIEVPVMGFPTDGRPPRFDASGNPVPEQIGTQQVPAITYIAEQVAANPNFSPAFKAHVEGVAALKTAQTRARQIKHLSATEGQAAIEEVGTIIEQQIGNALQNGIEISPFVQQVIAEVTGPAQAVLRQKVQESIGMSEAVVLTPNGGNPVNSHQVIASYQAGLPAGGGKISDDQLKLNFKANMERASGVPLSAEELDRAWRLVETYLGKQQGKPTKQAASGQLDQILADQLAIQSEEAGEV